MKYNCIRPGQVLLDTNGKRVQAHGGSIFYDDKNEIYYFYGENKEYTDLNSDIWTWGVRAYVSKDFYNWEDRGLIIEPDENDPDSPLNPRTAMLDRPHIIYNRKTKKYVCWCKVMYRDGTQRMCILTADDFLGPYRIVTPKLMPLGMSAGDFDLSVAPDGKGYYYYERVHSETIIADLTDDYTDVTGYYTEHFPHSHPPYVREATAHFIRGNKHWIITSGTTGYFPNPSEVAVSDTWHGPFTVLGNPHPADESCTSFHSQISSVFKVPGKKDLYVALADRWRPDLMTVPYDFAKEFFDRMFEHADLQTDDRKSWMENIRRKYDISDDLMKIFPDSAADTRNANYVWLPLRFIESCDSYPNGMLFIDWVDEWRLEDYE